ncbi:hypothetical protein ABZ135_11000 [Streptomyces sp. NPDC006339]|uniref:hypothetical protein n=1 Tax=Streptomyces sp. NPDC006339 TaxID=3156755 RepID=UPI0033B27324
MIRGRNRGRNADLGSPTWGHTAVRDEEPARAPSSRWLFTGGDGRMTAYATSAAGVVRWTETAPGTFDGPTTVAVEGWDGRLSLAASAEGYVYFAGLRRSAESGARHVVVSTQYQTGRPLIDWHDLGRPAAAGAEADDEVVSGPVVVVNQVSGSVHVLVSLRHGGVLRRSRTGDGRWGRWKTVTPQTYPGQLTAAMPTGGPLEVLAVDAAGTVDRWVGAGGGRFELRDRFGMALADGTQTALETARKRTTYLWRYPGDGSLLAWRARSAKDAGGVLPLGGAGGVGRPGVGRATIGGYDCTVLAQTGAHGGAEVTAYVTENEGYGTWWAPLGDPGTPVHAPQPGVDGAGNLVVAALDGTGALLLARQDPGQDGLAFGPWTREGSHAPSAGAGQG